MVDQSSDQSSGFWTLTRPSKLSKRRNSDLHELHHKVFNICVVGLSGTEKDKGPIGIGKSCLCNRFVRSAADDYFTDHISVLSQSDFGGHVVNNDHWLYWGSVIKSCDGYDLAFNVIEQTEFVDDVCFQPFKSGKTEPYYRRCANTKLVSAEKLMYICKSQLGIEREYEQRYLPDGKFNVDGFLCLFDVSEVQGRNIDKQIEMTNLIMLNLIKTRKPVVFVTTKHDEASEVLLTEAERLVNQRDFRGLVPIVETSAQENVNINMAFLICAQLIDKSRAKLRVPPYFEAYRSHLDLLKAANDAFLGLIRSTVHEYRSSWQQVCIKLSHNPEFLQYTYLHGLDRASLLFKDHIKRLHEDCINQKVQTYLKIFPDVLDEILSSNNSIINNNDANPANLEKLERLNSLASRDTWESVKEYIRNHPLSNKHFLQLPDGVSWYDTELLQTAENRIPLDWLNSNEAYAIFQQRNLHLEMEQRRQFAKETFARMLTNLRIPVGKPFIELKHVFAGSSELEILNDQELFEIYVEYQNNLLQKARADFQELLLENGEHLHHLTSSDKVIRQDDIKTINAILQHDERYQALDRFDQDRTLMMIRHLSFLKSQISEQCPSYPKNVETTDNSIDNRQDNSKQPKKPGKLDLRQFDNITTAIGKLSVQPSSASPTSIALVSQSSSTPPTTTLSSSKSSTPAVTSKHSTTESQTPNSRRINNLRQNHGRAVAPPKLPTNLQFKSSLGRLGGNETTSQNRTAQSLDEESAIDFSQSPIAQRLLKHARDHKVSELNSPYESDSEPQQQTSGHVARAQELLKGTKNVKSTFNRNSSLDSSELISTRGETIRQLNEILAKKPPGHPIANKAKVSRGSSNDRLIDESNPASSSKKDEKDSKKDRKKLRSDEKLEKRKLKDEERWRRQEEEKQRRQDKKLAGKKPKSGTLNSNSLDDDGIPLFIKCCIEFIESEGLDAEGIYRVPGNRAHVDAFVHKFKENPDMSILESDIPVNAVATALKDFLSKTWGPIIPLNMMNELTELSSIPDKNRRVEAVKELVKKLPTANYKLLKYVFSHFVKVSSNNTLNSMDSKNLAICWWPTLLPLHFSDMVMFEQMRPHLEESIQTMIDQYDFIFDSDGPS